MIPLWIIYDTVAPRRNGLVIYAFREDDIL